MNIHIGLSVTQLDKSIEFYTKLFGQSPVKIKSDYAKFLLQNPDVNFTLNLRDAVSGNQVGHFGFQVSSEQELQAHKERLDKQGFFSREEINTSCCYAVQDKFWITDPDGNEWEFFYTKEDIQESGQKESVLVSKGTCC